MSQMFITNMASETPNRRIFYMHFMLQSGESYNKANSLSENLINAYDDSEIITNQYFWNYYPQHMEEPDRKSFKG